jgi:hypothetical protein
MIVWRPQQLVFFNSVHHEVLLNQLPKDQKPAGNQKVHFKDVVRLLLFWLLFGDSMPDMELKTGILILHSDDSVIIIYSMF